MFALMNGTHLQLTFFEPTHNQLLNALGLRALSTSNLWPAAVVLALVLGYCAYTDIFRGKIIKNSAVMAIFLASGAIVPLIYAHPLHHYIVGLICIVPLFFLYMTGVFVEGDLKLLAALAILFAQGIFVLLIASFLIIIIYGAPKAIQSHRLAHRKGEKAGKTKVPAGPGIALAYPLTLFMWGVSLPQALGLVGVELLTILLALLFVHYNLHLPPEDEEFTTDSNK